jgi:hypothetical protein
MLRAAQHYNKKELIMINRVRLYLQVITMYDLLTYDGVHIQPEIMEGKRVISRQSTIFRVDFKRSPKNT